MSLRFGNSAGEKARKAEYSKHITSALTRRKIAHLVRPMTRREELEAIEAAIQAGKLKRVVLVPPEPIKIKAKPRHPNKGGRPRKPWNPADDPMLKELRRAGKTFKEIARAMGKGSESVRRRSAELGLHGDPVGRLRKDVHGREAIA